MSQSTNGIVAYASYVPRYVLTRTSAREAWPAVPMRTRSRSVPALDEDPITMGAHASFAALERAGVAGSELAAIFFASASSPYIVKSAAAVIADYVGAPSSVCLLDLGSGAHAGLLALITALRDSELGRSGPILVIGADAPSGEPSDAADLAFGAAAAAYVVAPGGFAELQRFASRYSSYSNVWQTPAQRCVQRYDDERFEREVGYSAQMQAALAGICSDLDSTPDWFALASNGGGDAEQVLTRCKIPTDRLVGRDVAPRTGDTGCASALINLGIGLDAAGADQTVVAQAYGAGAGTVSALIRVTTRHPGDWQMDPPPADPVELSYVQFAKHRGHIALPVFPSAGSAYAASPAWERGKLFSVGLNGQRCRACASLNFPRRDYCLDCRSQELDIVPLPRRGTVLTYNLQHILPIGPEEAPLPVCTVLIDGEQPGRYGGKVAALLADGDLDAVEVGMHVELIPRRGDVDDGLVKYGWKFRPLPGGQ